MDLSDLTLRELVQEWRRLKRIELALRELRLSAPAGPGRLRRHVLTDRLYQSEDLSFLGEQLVAISDHLQEVHWPVHHEKVTSPEVRARNERARRDWEALCKKMEPHKNLTVHHLYEGPVAQSGSRTPK